MEAGTAVESNPVAVAEAPTGQSAPVQTGTPENQNGQANDQGQSAPGADSFTDIDPNTLPPELQAKYKSMLADYTRKTQSIADVRKKAETYDQISKDQRFIDYWNGLNRQQKADLKKQEPEAVKKLAEVITPEEFQQAFTSQEKFLELLERAVNHTSEKSQKEINALKQQLSVKDAGDVVESFATQVDKASGQLIRPDFYALDEDGLITGYLSINQPEEGTEKAYMQKLNEAYTWAKGMTQKYYEKGRADALARIQQKAATSTEPPTNAAKGAYTGPDPKKLTPGEAFQLAKKGIRVPRDD